MPFSLSYPIRNLYARRTRTLLTAGVISLVVVATGLFLGLIHSLERTLASTGDPRNLIVLRKGANNDGSSTLSLEAYQNLRFFEGIARDAQGEPMVSPELVVQPFFETRDGGRENVLVRGVEPMALAVHDEVRIVEGRALVPSSGEAMVGEGVARRYSAAGLGSELRFGRSTWKVVGILASGGSSFESEVWVDARELASDARRAVPYSGARLRVADGADMDALARRIADDPRWALEAKPETEYYAQQSESANSLYVIVIGIAVLAGTGAVFGASNTLYASVQARTAEIGTLRAIGFSRGMIASAFLVEALVLSLVGFGVGGAIAWVLGPVIDASIGGVTFPSSTFTTSVIALRVGLRDLLAGFFLSLGIGVLGGLAPAIRASRLRPVEALRRA
jgi:putative ABC transport system permease protein